MDARCKQVYTALFDIEGDKVTRLTEDEALKIEDLKEILQRYNKRVVFVGDGAEICHRELGYDIAPPVIRYQNAASVGICAFRNFAEDKLLTPDSLMPVYLRLPQAERELKKKTEAK